MITLINLTQHPLTREQVDDFSSKCGDVRIPNISGDDKETKDLLTFDEIPTLSVMEERARKLIKCYEGCRPDYALIGGAPYFMPVLERELRNVGIIPIYSFSKRISTETVVNGEVVKTSSFKHVGFIGF